MKNDVRRLFPEHYSYEAYADPAMAERFDRERFGGAIGALVHRREEQTLVEFLGDVRERRILDVGTGTGRAALVLGSRGAHVTGVDASAQMLAKARERAANLAIAVTFQTGDAHALDFPDRAFDAVVGVRLLMHVPDWKKCLSELCRVSREVVLLDYPALVSAAALQSATRRIMLTLGRRVEAYRVFTDRAIRIELARRGFHIVRARRQFALPIALHKAIGSPWLTERTESALAAVGARSIVGSPVMILARRTE